MQTFELYHFGFLSNFQPKFKQNLNRISIKFFEGFNAKTHFFEKRLQSDKTKVSS